MLDEIKKKLNDDINCRLDIRELKILYEIDDKLLENIDEYRNLRNNYEDLCTLFGKEHIATSINDINENTICFVGNLEINKELPTYNLRYIYGSLNYNLFEVTNLENLEIIYGSASFLPLMNYEGLENLKIVTDSLFFSILESIDLSTIDYVKYLNTGTFSMTIDTSTVSFPKIVEQLYIPFVNNVKNVRLPQGLKCINVLTLDSIRGLRLSSSTKVYMNKELVSPIIVRLFAKVISEKKFNNNKQIKTKLLKK